MSIANENGKWKIGDKENICEEKKKKKKWENKIMEGKMNEWMNELTMIKLRMNRR